MKVNFNGVRKSAVTSFENLTDLLTNAIIKVDDQFGKPNGFSHVVNLKGYIIIDVDDIQEEMDDLRMLIGTIAMCYEEGSEDCKNVYEEIFPEGKSMKSFNDDNL